MIHYYGKYTDTLYRIAVYVVESTILLVEGQFIEFCRDN